MSNRAKYWDLGRLSRRDALLKVCLLPAGAVAARVLSGCSDPVTATMSGAQTMAPSTPPVMPMRPAMQPAQTTMAGTPAMMPMMPRPMMPSTSMGAAGSMATPPMAGIGGAPMNPGMMMGGAAGMGGSMSDVAGPDVKWATGGTKSMMGNYPNPFATAPGTACRVYPSQTLGPCYAQGPMMREDISDSMDGLPTRISLLVVDADCKPVPNATVDIWAAGADGIYSAYAMGTICNPGNSTTMGQMFGRGVQMTNESGIANFNSVFPGWYRGRTIHFHFTLRAGGRMLTSQLYFKDPLTEEILAQGHYMSRGKRDTTNMSDGIFRSGGATADQVCFETAKRPDGVLHAWKVLSMG